MREREWKTTTAIIIPRYDMSKGPALSHTCCNGRLLWMNDDGAFQSTSSRLWTVPF